MFLPLSLGIIRFSAPPLVSPAPGAESNSAGGAEVNSAGGAEKKTGGAENFFAPFWRESAPPDFFSAPPQMYFCPC